MANIKFSQFTADGPIDGSSITPKTGSENSFLVGYNDTENTNNQWTLPQIAQGLATVTVTPYSIYAANGTIIGNRVANLQSSGSLKIQDSSNVDLLSISENGAFALGKGATPSISQSVVIGDTASANQRGISIGYSTTSGDSGVTIGWDAGVNFSTGRNINIGHMAQGSGFNSILLSAAPGNGATTNTDNYNFSVYMTSKATPDFKVVGGGESVLNTSLQITGQGYSSIETGVVISSNIDFNQGNVQEVTLVANTSTDFDPINFKAGATYILKLEQPTGGNGLVDWEGAGATVNWPGGTPPTLSTAAAAVDIVTLICTEDLTGQGTYYANATLNFS
jgi:hypothetical protein